MCDSATVSSSSSVRSCRPGFLAVYTSFAGMVEHAYAIGAGKKCISSSPLRDIPDSRNKNPDSSQNFSLSLLMLDAKKNPDF